MDDIQLNLIHDENVYIKYFDINTTCLMFDYHLDEETLCKNVTDVLVKDCVLFEEKQKVVVEIPAWDIKYDVILKSSSINNMHCTKYNVTSTNTKQVNDGPFDDVQNCMSETKTWTNKAIQLLIANRGDLEHEFNSNKKNHKIWEKISNILKENGIAMSGPNCNTKFRNLMATFRDNVQRANKSGVGAINWEYYLLMKHFFGKKDSVGPNENTILESSLPNSSKTSLKDKQYEHTKRSKLQNSQPLNSTFEEINSMKILQYQKRKKNFQEILLEEMKKDREARDSFQNKLEHFMDKLIQIETAKLDKM